MINDQLSIQNPDTQSSPINIRYPLMKQQLKVIWRQVKQHQTIIDNNIYTMYIHKNHKKHDLIWKNY